MKKLFALALAAMLSACAGTSNTPAQPLTQTQIQQDMQMGVYLLQAAGCAIAEASAIAAPVVMITSDAQGQQVLQAVSAGGVVACKVTVPPTALPAPVAAGAPAVTAPAPATAFRKRG